MIKNILVATTEGTYCISALEVAKNRADYFTIEVDGLTKDSPEYMEEVNYALSDKFELLDWLLGNSDWIDWKDKSTKVSDVCSDTENFWSSSDSFTLE